MLNKDALIEEIQKQCPITGRVYFIPSIVIPGMMFKRCIAVKGHPLSCGVLIANVIKALAAKMLDFTSTDIIDSEILFYSSIDALMKNYRASEKDGDFTVYWPELDPLPITEVDIPL